MWFPFDAMFSMFSIVSAIITLVIIGMLIAIPVHLSRERREIRQAWHDGYAHAMAVHQATPGASAASVVSAGSDAPSSGGSRDPGSGFRSRSDAWAAGYRQAVGEHGWRWSERDSQELWHNPHATGDAARIIARSQPPMA
ncbi:hypothetical protein [Bifidobacterium samirii]|uniref:Uncharacterized protein n=1 Tax=Bifidobacterium samirii TaxID=2306974 RepID=A0A430FVH9_9BIFI|nr:hypothetical protein [Bifidobacterium samirii]RSX57778.1 hypothetical protein D2E24_0626 [Bifidobacterium samirii]